MIVWIANGLVAIMSKRALATDDESKNDELIYIVIPIYEAHVLLGIANDLEDDERYGERAKALITASHHHVTYALKLIEQLRDVAGQRSRKRSAS